MNLEKLFILNVKTHNVFNVLETSPSVLYSYLSMSSFSLISVHFTVVVSVTHGKSEWIHRGFLFDVSQIPKSAAPQCYNLFKLSVLCSSFSHNSGPWLMFLQNMQSMCRWSVSSALTAVHCNIKVYSSVHGSSSPRPRLCIAAVDFLLSCCFSMWAESSCISQIRNNPTSVAPLFAYGEYLQGVTHWKEMCAFAKL